MSVFISWSKRRSKEVAIALRQLLDECLCPMGIWTSTVDMGAGLKWFEEIERHLGEATVGIVCITPENFTSPWVLFEAGSMLRAGRLIPYLVDAEVQELPGPLQQYQACPTTRDGTLTLVRAVNASAPKPIDDRILETRFDAFWPTADQTINRTKIPTVSPPTWLGIEAVYPSRADGFDAFVTFLRTEVQDSGPRERLWIIGSSLQGFDSVGASFTIWDAIDSAVRARCLRVLLTAPEVSHYRESPENRIGGQIRNEIGTTLNNLYLNHRVPESSIRLYPGTPTVAAIASSTHMLLNPYPYGRSAYKHFSLIARKTSNDRDIYNQYIEAHFKRGWEFGRHLSDSDKRWLSGFTLDASHLQKENDDRTKKKEMQGHRLTSPSTGRKPRKRGPAG